jgi:hypothetical protein
VGGLGNFVNDDENDTLLFNRLQEHVLEHYPNPDRVGCFDHATLVLFVETPGKLDLEDPKYLHVLRCAECTRDLIELRRLRDERLAEELDSSVGRSIHWWRFACIAAAASIVAILIGVSWRHYLSGRVEDAQNGTPSPISVDLSAAGLARGGDQGEAEKPISLPQRLVEVRLVLPFYSPGGNYRITVSRDRSQDHVEASGSASATANGSHTELRVELNLRRLRPGNYYLGTAREGDGAPYYYPALIRQ